MRVDEAGAAVVRQVYEWSVEEGLTRYGIAQRLSAQQVPTPKGLVLWSPATVRKILTNSAYQGTAYGNQQQTVPARRSYPLIGRPLQGAGGASGQWRPQEEWIGVPVPAIISTERFSQAQARLAQNRQWAPRNTQGEYLLRCLVSCRQCGLAHGIWNNGRYAYYRCKGLDGLMARRRPLPCRSRQVATERLDALVWTDLCQVLTDPAVLDGAVRRAQQGWLSSDERQARRQDLHRRRAEVERQIQRLVDAYTAEVLTLEELRARRTKLEERLEALRREEQQLIAEGVKDDQLRHIASQAEAFRARVAQGLERATFAERRMLVELLVNRVIVDAPEVEVRYVVPLTGVAERNGVLRLRHRTRSSGHQATVLSAARVRELCGSRTVLHCA